MKEDDRAALFEDVHTERAEAGKLLLQAGQLVVMGCEECTAAQLRRAVQLLQDGAGQGEAVVGAGASTDFVEDNEAARGRVSKDVGRLSHLDHKRAALSRQVILS